MKGHKEIWGDEDFVHYFDIGDGFMDSSVCQSLLICTL